ncbi:hypothetical protein ACFL2J_07760 [Candidatus Omnitrophota bacterium]
MKEENKKLLERTRFASISLMSTLLIIAILGLMAEGLSATVSFLVVIALLGFLPIYLNLARILRSE